MKNPRKSTSFYIVYCSFLALLSNEGISAQGLSGQNRPSNQNGPPGNNRPIALNHVSFDPLPQDPNNPAKLHTSSLTEPGDKSQSIIYNVWEYARVVGPQPPLVVRPRAPAQFGGVSLCVSAIIGCCQTTNFLRRENCFEAHGCSGHWLATDPCGEEMMTLVLQSIIA